MNLKEEKLEAYLTETILTIHNEVQSAVDYISEVARKEGTEFGSASAIMGLERVRLKVPVWLDMKKYSQPAEVKEKKEDIRKAILKRKGFLIDRVRERVGLIDRYSKIQLEFQPKKITDVALNAEDTVTEIYLGELELVFMPLER